MLFGGMSIIEIRPSKNYPTLVFTSGTMSSNVSASLVLEKTSREVCLRSNCTEVQTTRQFIRSRPTGTQSSRRRTLVYIANFTSLHRMSCNSKLFTSDEGFVCNQEPIFHTKSSLSYYFINSFYLI